MTKRNTFCLTALWLLLSLSVSHAQDWSQWRGPQRTGITSSFKAPARWPERPTQAWKVPAGAGHASPVVSGSTAYLFSRVGEQETVTALELSTGRQLWRQEYDAPYQMNPAATGHGKGPKSTPILHGGRLFTFGISGVLSAWDVKGGRLAWRKDFAKDFPSTSPHFGVAMSPAVIDGRLIVHAGGPGNGALLALDPARGDVKWAWKGDGPAYASPIVADIGGTRQVITQSEKHVVGLSLGEGRPLWQIPFTTSFAQNIVTAVVVNDLVVFTGLSKPLTAVRVARQGNEWAAEQVWQNESLPMYMSSPILADGRLYGFSHRNRGQFFCADVQSGKTLWTTRGREGDNAALILAGGYLMASTTEGELVVARPDPAGFEPLRRYTIAESPVWAHPVPAGSGVLIKDLDSLAYWTFGG